MSIQRIRGSEWLVGAGGLAMLVSLFLPWFAPGESGWASLGVVDLLVAATAVMAIALPAISAGQEKTDFPLTAAVFTAIAALVALVAVVVRLIDPLGGREAGIYLALAGTLVTIAGAWRTIDDEGP